MKRVVTGTICCLLLAGCLPFGKPKVIVGQKSVPPPVEKPAQVIEAERQTAKLIADNIKEPTELVQPARELSNSLGQPDKPIDDHDLAKAAQEAVERLRAENAKLRRQVEDQRTFLRKYAGHKIEDTGFDVGGLLTGSGMLAFIAVLIFVPGAMGVFLFIIKRLRDTLRHVLTSVEQYRKENPEAVQGLEDWARENMDEAHKKLVEVVKKSIPHKKLQDAEKYVAQSKAG